MSLLSGKVALVTGAGRGLGQKTALTLAASGAEVVVVSRSEAEVRMTAQSIQGRGGHARAIAADVSRLDEVDRVRDELERSDARIAILVNAAGVFGPIQLIKDSDPRRWADTLAVNLLAPYYTCRAFAPGMVERGWGRIVNFSSAASLHPPGPLNSAYATSKVALNQLTRHLAAELLGTGVTANVVHPGDVKTEMWAQIRAEADALGVPAEGYRRWADWVEETGGDDPQKAADLVLRLAGEEGAAMTGRFLWIEGGLQAPIPSWGDADELQPWLKI